MPLQIFTKSLTREELAKFLPSQRAIKAFENLVRDLTEVVAPAVDGNTTAVEEAQAAADAAQAAASSAQSSANAAQAAAAAAQSAADDAQNTADAAQAEVDAVAAVPFVVIAADAAVPNARSLAVGMGLSLADAGAGAAATLNLSDILAVLPGDVSESAGTLADATGLALALAADRTYLVDALIAFQAAAITTGLAVAFTLPAGASIVGAYLHNSTTTTFQGSYNNASGAVAANTSDSGAAAADLALIGRWVIKTGGTAGNAQLQFRSEVAGSAITLKAAMSTLVARRIA
jgi:hypothetical protein